MSKAYVALKAVDIRNGSAWCTNPALHTTYNIGERAYCKHPKFPFYLVTEQDIDSEKWLNIGCPYYNVMSVVVLDKHLTPSVPFYTFVNTKVGVDLSVIRSQCYEKQFRGATSVLPVGVIDRDRNLKAFLKAEARRLHLPILQKN